MNEFDFNWKYKNFEIRMAKFIETKQPYIELVTKDDQGKTFTLAYWVHGKYDGWCLQFVCQRPLEYIADIDIGVIWKQLFLAQQMFEDADLH